VYCLLLGTNSSSTTTSKASKATISHPPASITKPDHTTATGKSTINHSPSMTKPSSIGSHSVANHQSTGANKGAVGGYSKTATINVTKATDLSKWRR